LTVASAALTADSSVAAGADMAAMLRLRRGTPSMDR
jgi:hypothetical protein